MDSALASKKIRVMIVDDSPVICELLRCIIERDPRLEVAAVFESAEEALEHLHRISPDVISIDIRLPGMNGVDATRRIMSIRPTPIVVIAGSAAITEGGGDDSKISIQALRAGALAVVEKPVGVNHSDYEAQSKHICTQLAIMSQVKVVRRRLEANLPAKEEFTNPMSSSMLPKMTSIRCLHGCNPVESFLQFMWSAYLPCHPEILCPRARHET